MRFLRADGLLTPAALGAALVLSAAGVAVEAVLYRTFLDVTGVLGVSQQRLTAIGVLLAFLGVLLVLDLLVAGGLLGIGRRLEARFRIHLLEKIPRLPDRYFSSRLVSDMAERGHSIHQIRTLPALGGQLVYFTFQLLVTAAGICSRPRPAQAPRARRPPRRDRSRRPSPSISTSKMAVDHKVDVRGGLALGGERSRPPRASGLRLRAAAQDRRR